MFAAARGIAGKTRRAPGTQIQVASLTPASPIQSRRFIMRSKLAIALVVTSLLGATAVASAQTEPAQPAPGASNEAGPSTTKMKSGKMKTSKMKSGTTTGMSSGPSKRGARNPSGEGNAAPDADNDAGSNRGK
jgi:hypothetical protein